MASGDDLAWSGEEPRTENQAEAAPVRVYSSATGRWEYVYDDLDPKVAARMDREWRAMPAREKRKAIAAALLFLSPVIAMFALMPFAFAATGEAQDRLERAMAMLLLGQLALAILIVAIAKLLPRKPKDGEKTGEG